MTILLVHPDEPESPSSWSQTPISLINSLRAEGVSVIPFKTGPSNFFLKLSLSFVQYFTKLDYHYSVLFRRIASRRLKGAILKNRPNAVLHLGSSSAVTFLKCNVPQYLYCDNTWNLINTLGRDYINPKPSKELENTIDLLEKKSLRKFTAIFTQTELVKNNLIQYYKLEANVHRIGVGARNAESMKVIQPRKKRQILFIARNSFNRKGGGLLLEAFKIIKLAYPDSTLILEGGGSPKGIRMDGVVINGLSDQKTLEKLFQESYVLAMPSLFEPFGLVYIEALASGLPIMGLNRGSLPDITNNGEFGFLADIPTPEEVAKIIIEMFEDREMVVKKTKLGQKYVCEEYTWKVVTSKMLQVMAPSFQNSRS